MKNTNEVIYMVIYRDDRNQKHMIFVKGYSSVKFLKDRFGEIYFEQTEKFTRTVADQSIDVKTGFVIF